MHKRKFIKKLKNITNLQKIINLVEKNKIKVNINGKSYKVFNYDYFTEYFSLISKDNKIKKYYWRYFIIDVVEGRI